jgi:predicted RecB family nuclease
VREKAIAKDRNIFKLSDFRGVNPEHVARLKTAGINNIEQMLAAGSTVAARQELAGRTGVPVSAILELASLSDLSRLDGVKAIRARLYYDAGVDTVEKLASFEPEELLRLTAEFVQRTGFEGIAPLPKEVLHTIEAARKLPKIVEY